MSTTTQAKTPTAAATGAARKDVVRLSVNLASDVADALQELRKRHGVNLTEGIRRAIALWKLVSDENAKGNRIMVVEGEGDKAKYRELIML